MTESETAPCAAARAPTAALAGGVQFATLARGEGEMGIRSTAICWVVCQAIGAGAAGAADVKRAGTINDGWGTIARVNLEGRISPGDARKIEQIVEEDDSTVVFLKSIGGDYREGLRLAELFKLKKIRTAVAAGDRCMSACGIAFLGGTAYGEEGTEPFARSIHPTSTLAFHAPFLDLGSAALTNAGVEDAYDRAIKTVTDFVRAARGLGVSPEVAADMMTPQRDSSYTVSTIGDALRIGIAIQGFQPVQTLTLSMLRNLCLHGWLGDDPDWDGSLTTMVETVQDRNWPPLLAIPIKTDSFSGDVLPGTRFVVPVVQGGEAIGMYSCLVDAVRVEGELRIELYGAIYSEQEDLRALERDARAFVAFRQVPDHLSKLTLGVTDPLAREAWDIEGRYGIVPRTTPITQVRQVIDRYLATEPHLIK